MTFVVVVVVVVVIINDRLILSNYNITSIQAWAVTSAGLKMPIIRSLLSTGVYYTGVYYRYYMRVLQVLQVCTTGVYYRCVFYKCVFYRCVLYRY